MEEPSKQNIVVIEDVDLPMTWYADTLWVEATIKAMFVIDIFPLLGLPLYLIIMMVIYFHYQYMNIWSLAVVLDVMETEVEGAEQWTISNWFLFPVRRSIMFSLLSFIGLVGNLMLPINFIIVPITGLLTWINNYY